MVTTTETATGIVYFDEAHVADDIADTFESETVADGGKPRIFLTFDSERNFRGACKALGIPKFSTKDGTPFLPWNDADDVESVRQKLLDMLDCLGPATVDMRMWTMARVRACDDRLNFLNRRAKREEQRNKMEFVNPAGDKVGDKRPPKYLAHKAAKSAESKAIRAKMQSVKGSKK